MEKQIGVVGGYNPVAGEWYDAVEYPHPAVYHEFVKEDTFSELYPDLTQASDPEKIEELINNTKPGKTTLIKLTEDLLDVDTIQIPLGSTVKLDLNGHKIVAKLRTEDRHFYAIDNYGTMIICGKGSIEARGIENFGKMEIKDSVEIIALDGNGGAAIWNEGDLTINGGTFRTVIAGSTSDPYGAGCLNNSGDCVINAGTFLGASRRTYAIISSNKIVVNNANVKGAHGGLAVEDGVCTVKNGTFVSTEYYGLYVSNDADDASDEDEADILILGGTFEGKTYSVWIGSDVKSPVNSVIRIKGGDFVNPMRMQKNVAPDAGIVEYPEDKYQLVENADGSRTLVKKVMEDNDNA